MTDENSEKTMCYYNDMKLDNIVQKSTLGKRIRKGAFNIVGSVLIGYGSLMMMACPSPTGPSSDDQVEETEDNGNGYEDDENGGEDKTYLPPSIELSVIEDGSPLGAFVIDHEKGDFPVDMLEYKAPLEDMSKEDMGWKEYDGPFSLNNLRLHEGDYVFKGRAIDDEGNVSKASLEVDIDMPPDRTPPLQAEVEKMETGTSHGKVRLDDIVVRDDDRRFIDEEWVSGIKEASVYVAPIDSFPDGPGGGDNIREYGKRLDTFYSVTRTPEDFHTIEKQLSNADADYHVYTLTVDNALNEWVHYNGKIRSGGPTQMGHVVFGNIPEQGTIEAYAVKGDFEMKLGEYEADENGDFMAEINNYMEGETFELRHGGNSLQFEYENGGMDEDVGL